MFFVCFLLLCNHVFSQDTLNQRNAYGQKNGYWKIYGNLKQAQGLEPLNPNKRDKDDTMLVQEGTYIADLKTGVWKTYFPDGKLASQEEFKNDQRSGKFVSYYENGCLSGDGTFQNHGYFGKCRRYSKDTCGKVVKIRFDEPQPIKITAEYNHELYKIQNSKENRDCLPDQVADGQHTFYYRDKTICQEGEFKNGSLFNGKWYIYDKDNWLVKILVYKQGIHIKNAPLE